LLRNQGLFPVSHIRLTSRCAGAGREPAQAGPQKYSIPWTSCSVYILGLVTVQEPFFHEFELLFFFKFSKIHEFGNCCSGTGCTISCQAVRRNFIVYCLFCTLYYYYSFLCCPIKLSLSQPTSFTFCPFYSPSHWVRPEGASEWLHGPSCQLLG